MFRIPNSFSDEQRLVVGMFYYEQMSVKEIAQTLGISENTVKSRLSYGRKKIEMQVKELEKKGTKLYSLAPLPFLLLLFKNMDAQAMEIPNTAILQSIQQECTAVSGAGGTNTANVLKSSTKSAVKTAGGTAAKGIAAKIIAGITAAVIIGTTVGIVALNQKEEPKQETQQITQDTQQITQVKLIKKDIGFILDAAPSLKMEWGLDPYIYTGEYVSIMPMEDDSSF